MMKNRISRSLLLALPLSFALLPGCAIVKKNNRRVLNTLDDAVRIDSVGGKIAAAPLFVPVGLVAGVLDMVVVHPIASTPKAADDTAKVLWKNPRGSDFHQMMLFLPKVVATPLVFSGSLLTRSLFPID